MWNAWLKTRGTSAGSRSDGPFGYRFGDRLDVDGLEILLVQSSAGCLSGDAQDRNRIGNGRVQPGNHVRAGRAGGTDADADVARLGAGIAFGHVRGAFDMTRQDVIDRTTLLQRGIQRVDRSAGNTERTDDAFFFQNAHRCIDCSHLRHVALRSNRFGAIIIGRKSVLNAADFVFR